jgi:hypothetical protein
MTQDRGRVPDGRRAVDSPRMSSLLLALAGLSLAGCELLDFARNPTVTFKLPELQYAISTTDPSWKSPPMAFSQKIDCTGAGDCCLPPPGSPPELAIDCAAYTLSCDAGQCATRFFLELPELVDLAEDVPALMGMTGKVVSEITLHSLEYKIVNGIGVALPAVALSVAPSRVVSTSGNSDARLLATLPPTGAGATVMDTIPLEPDAKQAFQSFARDFQTPFNVIASTNIPLRSGSPPPHGEIKVLVSGTVTATF